MTSGIRRMLTLAPPLALVAVALSAEAVDEKEQAALAAVGKEVFLDPSLSNPPGMSCTSCHAPEAAFADPRAVSPGAVPLRTGNSIGNRLMYGGLNPNCDK